MSVTDEGLVRRNPGNTAMTRRTAVQIGVPAAAITAVLAGAEPVAHMASKLYGVAPAALGEAAALGAVASAGFMAASLVAAIPDEADSTSDVAKAITGVVGSGASILGAATLIGAMAGDPAAGALLGIAPAIIGSIGLPFAIHELHHDAIEAGATGSTIVAKMAVPTAVVATGSAGALLLGALGLHIPLSADVAEVAAASIAATGAAGVVGLVMRSRAAARPARTELTE